MARASFLLFPCAWILFAAFVSVVSWSFPVSACKVITFLPTDQTNLKKSCVKKSFTINYAAFWYTLAVGAFAPCICPQNSVLYMYTCARAYVCALRHKQTRRKKGGAKNFFEKSCKNIWR